MKVLAKLHKPGEKKTFNDLILFSFFLHHFVSFIDKKIYIYIYNYNIFFPLIQIKTSLI